eukprot:Skav215778  [mRNA]  locus=scaffold2278:156298:160713:+ [translate_table: standard]
MKPSCRCRRSAHQVSAEWVIEDEPEKRLEQSKVLKSKSESALGSAQTLLGRVSPCQKMRRRVPRGAENLLLAKLLWHTKDTELPRLRAAELERQQLVGRLGQARYDRDHLERNYTRILNGLQEHEARMEVQSQQLAEGLLLCRREGEEMVATMKDNDRSIAEMRTFATKLCIVWIFVGRKERWETEAQKLRDVCSVWAARSSPGIH